MRLTDFKVLTFDCYGTLIDWETGILNALRPPLRRDHPGMDNGASLVGTKARPTVTARGRRAR